jgi:hypothetical protein
MFDEHELHKTNHPLYLNNPYAGRVDTSESYCTATQRGFARTLLAQYICQREGKELGIDWVSGDAYKAELFKTISNPKPIALNEYLPLLSHERPSPLEPIILKVAYKGMSNPRNIITTPI